MNVDGISEQTLARFINLGWVTRFGDIFRLGEHTQQMAHLDGFGAKSVSNLMASLDKARNVEARQLLYAPRMSASGCSRPTT